MRYIALLALLVLSCSGDDKKSTGPTNPNPGSRSQTFDLNPGNNWNCCNGVIPSASFNAQAYCEARGFDYASSTTTFSLCECGAYGKTGNFVSTVTCSDW